MTKLSVDVPTKLLEETAQKRIAQLEQRVRSLERQRDRWQSKANDLQAELDRLAAVSGAAQTFVEKVKELYDLIEDNRFDLG